MKSTAEIIGEIEKEFYKKYIKVFKETQKPIVNLNSMLLGGDKK